MKKLILSLFALCTFCVAFASNEQTNTVSTTNVQAAPSIIGTWVADGKPLLDGEDLNSFKLYFTFSANKKVEITFDMAGDVDEEDGSFSVGFKATVKGTYTKSGNNLSISVSNQKPTVNVYKLQMDSQTEAMLNASGITRQNFGAMLAESMFSGGAAEGIGGNSTIAKLTATQLVLVDEGGTTMTFTRTK